MRTFLKISARTIFLLLSLILWGENAAARPKSTLDVNLALSHRVDHLKWSIAGNGVNILSELTWEDLMIAQATVGGRLLVDAPNTPFSPYLRGSFGWGRIYRGENQDSDFSQNNRAGEFSRSNNNADGGDVLDATFGLGLRFKHLLKPHGITVWVAPLVGYAYHEQNLEMTGGVQTIPPLGPFPGLNSTYETQWRGPWLGLDASVAFDQVHSLFASIEYHRTNYEGRANWNLRDDFAHPLSFFHKADGEGMTASLGLEKRLFQSGALILKIDYLDWRTNPGQDTIFLSASEIQRILIEEGILVDGVITGPLKKSIGNPMP